MNSTKMNVTFFTEELVSDIFVKTQIGTAIITVTQADDEDSLDSRIMALNPEADYAEFDFLSAFERLGDEAYVPQERARRIPDWKKDGNGQWYVARYGSRTVVS